MFKPTKEQLIVAALWVVFVLLFWFVWPVEKMGKGTAFFGLAGLTAVYAGAVFFVKKIFAVGERK